MVILYRVHLALCSKKATRETLCYYSGLHVSCNSFSRGYDTAQWSWFISFLHSHKLCGKAGNACAGNKLRQIGFFRGSNGLTACSSSLYENKELNCRNQVCNLMSPSYPKPHSLYMWGRNPPVNILYAHS